MLHPHLRFKYVPDSDTPAGGAGTPPPAGDEPDKKGKKKKSADDEPKKLELTEAELQEKIEKALAKQKAQFDKEQADTKAKADEDAKKKQGEYQQLYESEVAKGKEKDAKVGDLELQLKARDVESKLMSHLAENHKDYIGVVRYIKPLINFDLTTPEDDLQKRIKTAVDQYVKDNPRNAAGSVSLPPSHGRLPKGVTMPTNQGDQNSNNNGRPNVDNRNRPSLRW